MLARNVFSHPSTINLCITVFSYNTINSYSITYVRLGGHCIVSNRTICAVKTVNINLVSVSILDVNITIGCVLYRFNYTGKIIFVFGIIVGRI